MAETKEIYDFAQKYLRLFTEPDPPASELDMDFAKSAYALGFRIDLGEGFMAMYPDEAFQDAGAFLKAAPSIDDPYVLGTAIFSRWRLVTHWQEQSVLEEGNRQWFIAALGRLAELTADGGDSDSAFKGRIVKVEIHSNNIFSPKNPVRDEKEETLTILADGRVLYKLTRPNADRSGHRFSWTDPVFKLDQDALNRIMKAIGIAFPYLYTGSGNETKMDAPPGSWKMVLTNQWGRPYRTMGQLGTEVLVDGENLSDLIRSLTGRHDMMLFDGNPDHVERLEVRYRRGMPMPDRADKAEGHATAQPPDAQGEEGAPSSHVVWIYQETIVFDREKETVEHVLKGGPGHRVQSTMYLHGAVAEFLNDLDPVGSFTAGPGNPEDAVPRPNEVTQFQLSMTTKHGSTKVFDGTYDALSVPPQWKSFMDRVLTFISFYEYGEMFDEGRYGRALRRETDHVYVLVAFDGHEEGHWYLSDDPSVIDGDGVLAPMDGETHVGQVMQIIYGTEKEAPIVFGSLQKILRKSTPEDIARLRREQKAARENAAKEKDEKKS